MKDLHKIIAQQLRDFAPLDDRDINNSQQFWKGRKISKGEYFNMQNIVCNDLGLIVKGIFRIYFHDAKTREDKNVYFFSENQFVVSFKNLVSRKCSSYFIEAMEDSEIAFIAHRDLNNLYETHLNWAKFGRLLAEYYFNMAQSRTEEFIALSNEQRYIRLLEEHPNIIERIPAYHISSYLGIANPSLSRIRKRIESKKADKSPELQVA